MSRRRKRCAHCHELFWPDLRVKQQRYCGKAECQKESRRASQARLRSAHPHEASVRRHLTAIVSARDTKDAVPDPNRMPLSPLLRDAFPWEEAKEVVGRPMFVILLILVKLLERSARHEIARQVSDIKQENQQLVEWVAAVRRAFHSRSS